MRCCRSAVTLGALLLALGACAGTQPSAQTPQAERDCVTRKVTGSRILKRVCEGDVDATMRPAEADRSRN